MLFRFTLIIVYLNCLFLSLQLHDKYHDFVTDSERDQFIIRLQEVEDWLYEDGEDETKGVYVSKLEELKKVKTEARYVSCVVFLTTLPDCFLTSKPKSCSKVIL